MMMALVRSGNTERALLRTLASLVRGMVEGPLTEVLVAALPGDTAAAAAADASGAHLLETASWREALALVSARAGDRHLLLVESGVVLGDSFWPDLEETMARGQQGPFVTRHDRASLADRLALRLTGRISRNQAVIAKADELSGDPWSGKLRCRPQVLRAMTFRPGA